ncbi:class I SAM-dependent methyltransferase [Chitinimonas arctica]|uniref:Class I SAM-dependent methyltransferase n=1 Tax=Chitinimonas arctica TaxID=2594795 RepID=A0A516SDN4_9NEIS|nr:class I SAM-dependent methyltransferase [Chitinimonas arctica]QDQ26265.1 class I SAM-dependent methyltransferase [Chitinimonas arctica]
MSERLQELDRIAVDYHLNHDVPDKFIENLCQEYCCDWLETLIGPNDSVLELGYGDGITLQRLADKPKQYTVVEGAAKLVQLIREKHPGVEAIHTLFEDYQPTEPYDKVLALHVLEHVDDPVALARRMHGWLKPGGELVIVVPNSESLHRQLAVLMGLQPTLDTLSPRDHVVGHQRVYDLPTLATHLRESGFEPISERGFFVKSLPNGMMLDYSPALIQAMNQLSDKLPAHLLANLAVVARKV